MYIRTATDDNTTPAHCMLAIHTHSEYVILTDFPLQHWLHDCASVYVVRILPLLHFMLLLIQHNRMSYPKMSLVLSTHVYGVLACTYFRLKVHVCTAVVS